jgi:plastocyanin
MREHATKKYALRVGTYVLLAVALIAGAVGLTTTEIAHAGFPYFATTVTVTTPKPPEVRTYKPGEAMQFSGQFSWAYCGNAGNFRVYGRTTRPVAISQNHANFSPWTEITSATGRKTYTDAFTAPTKPGVYKFKYEIEFGQPCVGIRGASCGGFTLMSQYKAPSKQGARGTKLTIPASHTYVRSGVVTFEVRDEVKPPACPANTIEVIRNGATVCVPQTLSLTCSASATRIAPGETVTFEARTNESATFTWYEGGTANGAVLAGPETGTKSTLTQRFTDAGQYQVTAYAQNASGAGACTRGVTVGSESEEEEEEVRDEFNNIVQPDGTLLTVSGKAIGFDSKAGPAAITFELDPTLTNTTCGATWSAQNVAQCYMVTSGNRGRATEIDATGKADVVPATYRVECLALRDGAIVSSEIRICRQNFDTREQ